MSIFVNDARAVRALKWHARAARNRARVFAQCVTMRGKWLRA